MDGIWIDLWWLTVATAPFVALVAIAGGRRTRRLLEGEGSDRPLNRWIRKLADLPRPVEDVLFAHRASNDRPVAADDPLPRPLDLAIAMGTCPVCGQGLDDDVVLCRECFTPHHRTCFAWNGSCGTYACGSKRFINYTQNVHRYLALRRQQTVARTTIANAGFEAVRLAGGQRRACHKAGRPTVTSVR